MTLHDDALTTLTSWSSPDEGQVRLRGTFLELLRDRTDALDRDCHPDHLTASVIVVDPERFRVLLNLHGRYRRWMQFGGHCEEADRSLAAAALREGAEESGIGDLRLLSTAPVQLSRHEVQCGPIRPSHHLDVRYAARAPRGAVPATSDESLEVRWFDADALPDELEPEVRLLAQLALRL